VDGDLKAAEDTLCYLAYCHGVHTDGRPTYVVGDVHGHLDELLDALTGAGLIDDEAAWAAGDTHLWFLGDFVDRGPDGIGVIDLVMRLSAEAEKAGGQVEALLGNHEILLLGMHRYGDTEVPSDFGPRSFARSWEMNGGQVSDQEAVTPEHVAWLRARPALALVDDHLLMHSDTLEYLVWGAEIEEINEGIREVLHGEDIVEWWEVWRRLTTRHAFRGPQGGEVAIQLLGVLGGKQVVHGHSVIADQLGVAPAQIDMPFEYADGHALGVDGGVFVGGPCLVVRLPFSDLADDPDDDPDDAAEDADDEPAVADEAEEPADEPDADAEAADEAEDNAEDEPDAESDGASDGESDGEPDGEESEEPAAKDSAGA
jgi:hypothetical protein